MANPKGKQPVNITLQLVDRLKEYQKTHKYQTENFTKFVNDLLTDVIDKDELLKKIAPTLSIIGYDNDVLYLKDAKANNGRFAEIRLKNGKLYCNLDGTDDYCIHIRYAFAIPEVAKLNLRKP